LTQQIKIVKYFNSGIFEMSLAIFGALVIIILAILFIKISKNEFNKLMSSEMEMSTGRFEEIKV
jgi:hypothetical protein